MSFTSGENTSTSSQQSSWLKEFLKKEVELKVWHDLNSDGFPLWALIRGEIVRSLLKENGTYINIRKKQMGKIDILRHAHNHYRAFFNLFINTRPCYDAVFWTPAHHLHPDNSSKCFNDRIHGAYYSLFSRPVILENPNNKNFFRRIKGVSSRDVFLSSSISLPFSFFAKTKHLTFSVTSEDEQVYNILIEKSMLLSDGLIEKKKFLSMLHTTNRKSWLYESIARLLARKLIKKNAFLHGGCYLGSSALLSWHLHRYGFTIIEPQHGTATADHFAYNYPEEVFDLPGVRAVFPDYFLTFGERWGELISIPSQIIPVGNPYLESMVKKHANEANTDILVISQATDRITNLVPFLSKAFPERKVVLKLHPRESAFAEQYRELENLPNVLVKGAKNESILPMIANADIVVGFFSTALFEALAFQGKMICCFPHPYTVVEPEFNIFNDITDLIQLIQKGGKRVSAEVSEKYWKPNWAENIKQLPLFEMDARG